MLDKHDRLINDDILPRMKVMEDNQKRLEVEMMNVRNGQTQLENTVIKESQSTRDLLNKFVDHTLQISHTKVQGKQDIQLKKLDTKEKVLVGIIAIFSTGGFLNFIISLF